MNCSHRLIRFAYRCTLTLSAIGLTASPLALSQDTKKPIPLIFDTDIGNDVDDVLAMGVIHALETRKECKLLAVNDHQGSSTSSSFCRCGEYVLWSRGYPDRRLPKWKDSG